MGISLAESALLGPDETDVAALLHEVYVSEGYTPAERAAQIFSPDHLRSRGITLLARSGEQALLGMIIAVPPESQAKQIAAPDEAELQLLAVSRACRKQGIASLLLAAAEQRLTQTRAKRLVLSTQTSMHAAQRLYERQGYARDAVRDWRSPSRQFLVYTKALA